MSGALEATSAAIDDALARGAGPVRLAGIRGSAGTLTLAALLERRARPVVVVANDVAAAEQLLADVRVLLGSADARMPLERTVQLLPAWDVPPFEPLSPSRDIVAARHEALYHLAETRDPVIVTTARAWCQRVAPAEALADARRHLVMGDMVPPDELATHLMAWGFHRVPLVQDPGDVAIRGGIVDVFPPGYVEPIRLEFVGDEIESIRPFDPGSQRSSTEIEDVLLLPASELPRSVLGPDIERVVDERAAELGMARQDRRAFVEAVRAGVPFPGVDQLLPYAWDALVPLADHFPDDALVWVDGSADVEAALEAAAADVAHHAAEAEQRGTFHPVPESLYVTGNQARALFGAHACVEVHALDVLAADTVRTTTHTADHAALRPSADLEEPLAPVLARLGELAASGRVVVVAAAPARRDRVVAALEGSDLAVSLASAGTRPWLDPPTPGVTVAIGDLRRGCWWPDAGIALVTDTAILGEPRRIRRRRSGRVEDWLSSLAELGADDFVVHVDHGIGIYRGLRHMEVSGAEGDYLHLEYAGGDRLYVPVDRINVVQRYVGADGASPALDKLGGASWARAKAKAKESVLAMTDELIALYAQREAHGRRRYAMRDGGYDEFAAHFPFEETVDQQTAIEQVVEDLESDRPMDRLVCGDVGFGKTEVAMRAAFLAAMSGKQVAVLVPTTLLAQQHFASFTERFQEYPIVIEQLSRFRTAAEHRDTLRRLESGAVDIVVGTHRLLQKDVVFRDLGLLVIDEEHRFGVRDKERIRALRAVVDVLALTATPIPRTLNMALSGIRDLSVIATPPVDRLAIRTYVTKFDETVIRDAVLREFARGGQVFFVHNRVQSIERIAEELGEIVPEAAIAVAHGQMSERTLEKTMMDFVEGQTNLLVTSAIIESGLDIPNANTMLINRADTFGLAQLYQLRGRVGRAGRRAYAYLLIPGEHLITTDAEKRLQVLEELDDLGGGFRLAVHDLEIRGAGNLLGKQQSGNITAIGLELYTHLMEQAVAEAKGETRTPECEPEIQIGIPAYVPDDYVADVQQRLMIYKRLADAGGDDEIESIGDELLDRYGPRPPIVEALLLVMGLRRHLKALLIGMARRRGSAIALEFDERTPVSVDRLVAVVDASEGRIRLTSPTTLEIDAEPAAAAIVVAAIRSVLRSLESP